MEARTERIPLADALSRAPTKGIITVEVIHTVVTNHIGDRRLLELKAATITDPVLVKLATTIAEGWPCDRKDLPPELGNYFT